MHYDCLIVDDETAIASSTSEYFNLFELSSTYVTSYEQCIDFLKENTVSLLLLDIKMCIRDRAQAVHGPSRPPHIPPASDSRCKNGNRTETESVFFPPQSSVKPRHR